MKEERLLPVGTKVYSVFESSWGIVKDHHTGLYPLLIKFDCGNESYYTREGKVLIGLENPNLSITEYTLENGGFTPISEYWNKPKVGDWGYFWDNGIYNGVFFGRLASIETRGFGAENAGRWQNFSHEIPEHIKKQIQQ